MLTTKVKASSVINLTDARYFAAWEVEWLGFDLNPASENYIAPQAVNAIKEWVYGPKIVGEFDLQPMEFMREAVALLQLDAVQVGMFTDPDLIREWRPGIPVIKALVMERNTSFEELENQLSIWAPLVQAFLLDCGKNGITWNDIQSTRLPVSPAQWQSLCSRFPVILDLPLSAENVFDVLKDLPLFGIGVHGGEEEKTGYKSFDELDSLFEALEIPAG